MLEIIFARRRSVGMLQGDLLVNNTDYDLSITGKDGSQIEMVEPGGVFEAPDDMAVFVDANIQYTFRTYLNQGYARNES
jgi:hypothetical protein